MRRRILEKLPDDDQARPYLEKVIHAHVWRYAYNHYVHRARGLGLLGLNDSLLRSRLAGGAGANVRIMLLDPDCEATAARAVEVGESPQEFAAGIRLTMSRLEELPGAQVYLYGQMPVWRVIRLDNVMFLSTFGTWEGHESAMYKIIATPRGPLFHALLRHIEALTTQSAVTQSADQGRRSHERTHRGRAEGQGGRRRPGSGGARTTRSRSRRDLP